VRSVPHSGVISACAEEWLDWSELEREPHASVLSWYGALAKLRAQSSDLLDGRLDRIRVRWDEVRRSMIVERGAVTFQTNLGEQPVQLPRPAGQPVLSFPEHPSGERDLVTLGPESCCVWRA
jgi:maltooligosyltrehalose trehalohydrolase